MRARSGCAGCAVAARAACDALLIQLELEEDVPRHGLFLPASRNDTTGAWQIVSGRVRPHEKHITRTACAPGARCGASAARSRRRADELCFRGASSAGLAPAPSGKAGAGRQRASPRARGCLAAPARWDRAAGGRAHRPWHGSARQAVRSRSSVAASRQNRRFARMALLMLDFNIFRLGELIRLVKLG